ncbi:uncharacterized protein LOC122534664 [Frieseomelitta varia]|uniref:uncharacterized protein LOC122534664 n=1 Tax=Frieseomelitta varia TaxID=561572 RepID=UPI001CB6A74E|nr:uncharacterized protein LOC122534664 [Frieseomelitta varia]
MKTIFAVTCLLAAVTVVRGMDQDAVIGKYMEYLMPDIKPCADQFNIAEETASNIQQAAAAADMRQMGCLKACVMKRMNVLQGTTFNVEPIYKMIEVIHAGNDEDIKLVKGIAVECGDNLKGETDECNIGNKYTDCYVQKMFT